MYKSVIWPNFPNFYNMSLEIYIFKKKKIVVSRLNTSNFQSGFSLNTNNFENRAENWKPDHLVFTR